MSHKDPFSPRIAIFTHDTFGIGHVRRCLHIIQALADRAPQAAILFITGSPAVDMLKSLPQNAEYLKIPTLAVLRADCAKPPTLPIGLVETSLLRVATRSGPESLCHSTSRAGTSRSSPTRLK